MSFVRDDPMRATALKSNPPDAEVLVDDDHAVVTRRAFDAPPDPEMVVIRWRRLEVVS